MKTKLLTLLIAIIGIFAHGQVGINTTSPNIGAALEVYATDKGFLPPRLTTAQRDAIVSKPAGLMVYNIDNNCMQFWDSTQWIGTCTSAGTITDCRTGALSGAYTQGTAMTSGNTVALTVNVTQIGPWTVSSTTVNGVTFSGSGTFSALGAQNITLKASGTPPASGSFYFPFTLGTSTCSRSITFMLSETVVLPGNPQAWMRHNLGVDTILDPDVPVQAIHGNYYQWGIFAPVANANTPSDAIAGWNTTSAADGSWLDASKTEKDPCPSGFRVPTSTQFTNLISNTTQNNVGTFTNSPTNFGFAKVFTGGGDKMTLPAAGTRLNTNGALSNRGDTGFYWSRTQNGATNAYRLVFNSTSVNVNSINRTDGYSIRCISE